MGCGSDQSPGDASQETPTSADTTEVASSSTAPDETDSEMESRQEETSSSENEAEETSAGNGEENSSSAPDLTDDQKKRIGGRLQRLIRGDEEGPRPVEAVGSRGGRSVYEVIIQCDDPDALRDAGIPLNTVQGALITARLTIDQILEAATVKAVDAIRAATKQQLHSEEPREYERQSPAENGGG